MFEKVSKFHPDKIADRIAGALVDLTYLKDNTSKVAIEVLIGHGKVFIINETSCHLTLKEVKQVVYRICEGYIEVEYREVAQDIELAKNQKDEIRCGDNGIFKGIPISKEESALASMTSYFDKVFPSDGKYIVDANTSTLVICQSKASENNIMKKLPTNFLNLLEIKNVTINPLGYWTGGTNVDSGATNRKLGSDLGGSVTGGGLHGKDISKADVSVNIYCFLKAQELNTEVTGYCAIGDTNVKIIINNEVKLVSYKEIINRAQDYITKLGGFEKLAEYGLIQ